MSFRLSGACAGCPASQQMSEYLSPSDDRLAVVHVPSYQLCDTSIDSELEWVVEEGEQTVLRQDAASLKPGSNGGIESPQIDHGRLQHVLNSLSSLPVLGGEYPFALPGLHK